MTRLKHPLSVLLLAVALVLLIEVLGALRVPRWSAYAIAAPLLGGVALLAVRSLRGRGQRHS